MSKCKACGADIIWIKTPNGKAMPCDSQKVYFKNTTPYGSLRLVLPDGRLASGEWDLESDQYGYVSHFATCPSADKFRRSE